MAGGSDPRPDLSSWKEIAAYLGVSVRAAQKWERERALPVRRLPGRRSGVSARPDDLDYWRTAGPELPGTKTLSRGRWGIAAVAGLLAGATIFVALARNDHAPAAFRIEDGGFSVVDERGRELWRKTFEDRLTPDHYSSDATRYFWAGDLDGDGKREVLFAKVGQTTERSYLVCLTERGSELWRFRPGRRVSTQLEAFSDWFSVRNFAVAPLGPDGALRVVVTSVQIPNYPDQVALLTPDGRLAGEYWHSGYLEQLAVLGHDIYLGGISNGHKAATLVVLDGSAVQGASAESDVRYQLLGLPDAHEKARVLFPKTCISQAFEPYNFLVSLLVDGESITALITERRPPSEAGIWYYLSPDLRTARSTLTDSYRSYHAELRSRGQLDHDLTAEEDSAVRPIRIIRPEM